MPALSRKGDDTTTGGKILRGAGTVFCNGIPVGLHVSTISPHAPFGRKVHPPHNAATTTAGSPTVFAENCPILRVSSPLSCGHSVIQGSTNVNCP